MILKNPKISCKENISLVNWVWPCTSPWWSQVTEAASSLPHPAVCVFLTWAVSFNKVQLLLSLQKLFIFSFSPTLWYDLSRENEKQAPALFFSYPFLQELVLIMHTSSRLRTSWPSIPAFSLQLPFCGTVIYVTYVKMVLYIKVLRAN